MFEEYLQDASEFYRLAVEATGRMDDRQARRYFRASVFYAAGAIEAFVNYIAGSFAKANSLKDVEIAFLNDKALYADPAKGEILERSEFHRLEDKIKYLLKRFATGFSFQEPCWSKLMEFKDLRDSLVHPRNEEDETDPNVYKSKVRDGLWGIINVIDAVFQGIFQRPLRKQILDLIPD